MHTAAITRKRDRNNDFYPTPAWATEELIKVIGDPTQQQQLISECCVGDGAIADVFADGLYVTTNDLDKSRKANFNLDASTQDYWCQSDSARPDWTITNPPFNRAADILPLAYRNSKIGVAFLLRLTYLEPCKNRAQFLEGHSQELSDLIIFNPRIRFRADKRGTDSVTTAWMVWRHGWSGGTRMHFVCGGGAA